MSNLKIKTLGLPSSLTEKLVASNILTIKDFLLLNQIELRRKTGLTSQKVAQIHSTVIQFVAPKPIQASSLNYPQFILFHNHLDDFLSGGIKCGHITEFTGAPGLGKTQFCLHLAFSNSLNSKFYGVLYIDTEGAFSAKRLLEIGVLKYKLERKEDIDSSLQKILVWRPKNFQEILDRMVDVEVLVAKRQIGLVIIDSIGSIIRRQFGAEHSVERGQKLCALSCYLKNIAFVLRAAVVVTNHITTTQRRVWVGRDSLIPALGPSWSHWINSRLYLKMVGSQHHIVIAKSPELPPLEIGYCITGAGIEVES